MLSVFDIEYYIVSGHLEDEEAIRIMKPLGNRIPGGFCIAIERYITHNYQRAREQMRRRKMEITLKWEMISTFKEELKAEEKSKATIEKYVRDAGSFIRFIGEGQMLTKDTVISYKQHLKEKYAIASAYSMLVAVNRFLCFLGCKDCTVKVFKMQKAVFRPKEREMSKEEYLRLVKTARDKGKFRLCLIMQTICATGIRISELPFVTVEGLSSRRTVVSLKGKSRVVILPAQLCRELRQYARQNQISSGSIFVTKNGRPIDRSNILHDMKTLCEEADVDRRKVFPHNLRHLFALTYYKLEKDVCRLADILGHSNINTTRIYTLVSCEEQEQQIDGLGLVIQV